MPDLVLEHIIKSHNPTKKYDAVLTHNGRRKVIPFGQAGALDYLRTKDPARRQRYLTRHRQREDWANPLTPGFWSRWYLWEKPTAAQAETQLRARFGL